MCHKTIHQVFILFFYFNQAYKCIISISCPLNLLYLAITKKNFSFYIPHIQKNRTMMVILTNTSITWKVARFSHRILPKLPNSGKTERKRDASSGIKSRQVIGLHVLMPILKQHSKIQVMTTLIILMYKRN